MNIDHTFYFIFILNCFSKVKIKLAFDTKKKKLIPFLTIQSLERGFSDPTSPNIFELHLLHSVLLGNQSIFYYAILSFITLYQMQQQPTPINYIIFFKSLLLDLPG